MPKRSGYLYNKIYDWNNLLVAFKKARKGKSTKNEVMEFEYNLENELYSIQTDLSKNSYDFAGYNFFTIKEPKQRLIACAPFKDRVVHHAICNILEPILDRTMISDTYACRKRKGLHHAIKRSFYFFRNTEYVYKFDIQKYFYTIDHQILLDKLNRKFKDPHLMELLENLLNTNHSGAEYYLPFEQDTIFDYGRSRGLPIGNLTSQLFANFYLSDFDHIMKEKLKCRNYIRYMDDILIFDNSHEKLEETKRQVFLLLSKHRLHFHPHKNQISKTKYGVNFLGFRLKNEQIRLQNRNLVRFKHKLSELTRKEIAIEGVLQSFNGHLGYFNSGNCRKIVEHILDVYCFSNGRKKYKLAL